MVDADVLCKPTKPTPQAKVVQWLRDHERDLGVDPIILGEVRFGILLLRRGARRRRQEARFAEGTERNNCLPWGASIGMRRAQLLAELRRAGKAIPIKDSLIAATALVHGLTVATRNVRDFKNSGLAVVDPFAD